MFGSPLTGQSAFGTAPQVTPNPNKDIEVTAPPEDTVSAMEFSPIALQQNFLLAGSWDSSVRLWEVEQSGKTNPKQMQSMGGAVLDVCWADVSIYLYRSSFGLRNNNQNDVSRIHRTEQKHSLHLVISK